jgi:two-component system, LytTR family, response regulator
MLKAVIVEDEKKSLELLAKMIKKHCEEEVEVVELADSVESGVASIRKNSPDLVFLDIEMSDGSGFDLLNQLQDMNFDVIFVTASDRHAIRAIKYSAVDYLLKPIDAEELKAAVQKIAAKNSNTKNSEHLKVLLNYLKNDKASYSKIALPVNNLYEVVNLADIMRLEAEGSYTNFIFKGGRKILVTNTLKHYEDILPEDIFIRVHHHHIVNINYAQKFYKNEGGYVVMEDNTKITISRRKRDLFLDKIGRI